MHLLFRPLAFGADRSDMGETRHGNLKRLSLRITGVVQGVGFRPFVYRSAKRLGLVGFVRNTLGGVEVEAEGPEEKLQALVKTLRHEAPPISRLEQITVSELTPLGEDRFRVIESAPSEESAALVSPDVATCNDCLREMRDSEDRRYGYPFINCTSCGPRFTIVEGVPYDRRRTTMEQFALCPACAGEYRDPMDRRFHAEPNACPACGPQIRLVDPSGHILAQGQGAVSSARMRLGNGEILAIKGLGGFHLACDATCEEAVRRLRRRKGRPHKPLAVMCADLNVARAYCEVSEFEARELTGPCRPILLLRKRAEPDIRFPHVKSSEEFLPIAAAVAPNQGDLGVMLPYTPLHHLLLEGRGLGCLVMTSGNMSEEPIVIGNQEATQTLGRISDGLIIHDRDIWNRCDDSVGFMDDDRLVLMRRSRGFAPLPVTVRHGLKPTLALGAMTADTFALGTGHRVFLSQHIGDVDNLETLNFLRESIEKLCAWLHLDPEIIVCDLHPDLLTTHLAHDLAPGRRLIKVQHHHAHFAAALACAGLTGPVQGLILDGTGFGPDRTVWGGELLLGDASGFVRAGHMRLLPLPGGEASIRRPLRLAVAYLHAMVPEAGNLPLDLWRRVSPEEVSAIHRMVDRGFNTPMTSSMGRLFDAVAALLGIRDEVTYEGQAAVELEQLARYGRPNGAPELHIEMDKQTDSLVFDPAPLMAGLVDALVHGTDKSDLAAAFHKALARTLAAACERVLQEGGPERVVLSGGVFQNRILTRLVSKELESKGLNPALPGLIPVNDAGISLGQVIVANQKSEVRIRIESEF